MIVAELNQPLDEIPQVEEQPQRFLLLCGVDRLVVDGNVIHAILTLLANEEYAEEVDCLKSLEWDKAVVNNRHDLICLEFVIFFLPTFSHAFVDVSLHRRDEFCKGFDALDLDVLSYAFFVIAFDPVRQRRSVCALGYAVCERVVSLV
ncbi:MAG: hypothetical protein Q4E99_06495, partial [Bacillota bacterium]|nr:hypothetical protein [Bacillota bacterium]